MVTNYNEIYIEQRFWEDNYKAGDVFELDSTSNTSRLKPFIGLKIKSLFYKLGVVCLIFDWEEWKHSSNNYDNNKSVQLSINNIAKFE